MGIVVNVSAGSPLLRVQTAPRHGGEGRRGHAVAAADPSRSYCSPDLPRDCSWESQCCSRGSQGCATTRTHDVGAKDALPGLLSSWGRKRKKNKLKKKKKKLCQSVAPTLQMLQCCFIRVSLWLLVQTQPRHTLETNWEAQGVKHTSREAQLTSTHLFLHTAVSLKLEGLRQRDSSLGGFLCCLQSSYF